MKPIQLCSCCALHGFSKREKYTQNYNNTNEQKIHTKKSLIFKLHDFHFHKIETERERITNVFVYGKIEMCLCEQRHTTRLLRAFASYDLILYGNWKVEDGTLDTRIMLKSKSGNCAKNVLTWEYQDPPYSLASSRGLLLLLFSVLFVCFGVCVFICVKWVWCVSNRNNWLETPSSTLYVWMFIMEITRSYKT